MQLGRFLVSVTMAIAIAITAGPGASIGAAPDRMPGIPRVIVWAWERPEDLRGLNHRAGVAYLAATYRLQGAALETVLRRQPLKVDKSTALIAVVRIETDLRKDNVLDRGRATWLASQISALRNVRGVRAVQIDFDARLSERDFYRGLLTEVRRQLGDFPLSITALASWCASDRWIEDLPVDEAVPMLFRMGPVHEEFLEAGAAANFKEPLCRDAVGVSTDEPTPALRGRRRTYIFHPRSWTSSAVDTALAQVTRWQ